LEHASSATALAVQDVSLPYLLSYPSPAPPAGKTDPRVSARLYYADDPASRQANSAACRLFCFAKILVQRELRKIDRQMKCCFSDLTPNGCRADPPADRKNPSAGNIYREQESVAWQVRSASGNS
jgi:hypothetical protein